MKKRRRQNIAMPRTNLLERILMGPDPSAGSSHDLFPDGRIEHSVAGVDTLFQSGHQTLGFGDQGVEVDRGRVWSI